ncbi:MAG: glutamate racemase [Treponema sp.]|nr:glutamate racemase [Treponema sp.]
MDERPVVFIDSGIGSLPYGDFFRRRNPEERLLCAADRAHFPYGSKPKEQVISLVSSITSSLISLYNPKIIVLACNTASVSALDLLREQFPSIPFVGTVPAIKPAVLLSKSGRVGVLATERTIKAPHTAEIAARYGGDCEIIGEAAPGLVEFVEHRFAIASDEERLGAVKPWIDKFKAHRVDALVLGCTHFLLLAKEFQAAAGESMSICDSLEGVCSRIEFLLDRCNRKLRAPPGIGGQEAFIEFTGEAPIETHLLNLAAHFGFKAGLF